MDLEWILQYEYTLNALMVDFFFNLNFGKYFFFTIPSTVEKISVAIFKIWIRKTRTILDF